MSSAAQVVKSSGWLCKWGRSPRSSYCGVHTPGRLSFVEMSTFLYIYTLIYTLQVIPRFLKHRLWKQLLYTIVVLNQTSDYKNLVMTLSTLPPPRATEQLFTNTSAVRGVIQPQRMARNAKKIEGAAKTLFERASSSELPRRGRFIDEEVFASLRRNPPARRFQRTPGCKPPTGKPRHSAFRSLIRSTLVTEAM